MRWSRYRRFRGIIFLGARSGRLADVNAALEIGAIFNADPLRNHVAGQGAFIPDVYPVAGIDVPVDFAEDNDFAGGNVGSHLAIATYYNAISGQIDGAFHVAVDVQHLAAGDFTFDGQGFANGRLLAA